MNAPYELDALILAGGQSRRMGSNKALLPYEGEPLIARIVGQLQPVVRDIRISTNDTKSFAFLNLPQVPDLMPDQGPLMGIASGLRASSRDWTLVVATDMPDLPLSLLPAMQALTRSSSCVVLRSQDGRIQPLFGLYHRNLADKILSLLMSGERRVLTFITASEATVLGVNEEPIANLNDPDTYHRALYRGSENPNFRQ